MLDLAPLDVVERDLDPLRGIALGPLDLLGQLVLALAEALGDLFDHAPPLGRVRLELVERLGDRLLGGALQLLAKPRNRCALRLARLGELRRLGLDSHFCLGDQLPLPLLDPCELLCEAALGAVEIVRPGAQPLLDPALRVGQPTRELVGALLLALHE